MTPQEIIEDLDKNEDFRQPLENIFKDKSDVLIKFLEDRINFEEQQEQIEKEDETLKEDFERIEAITEPKEEPSIITQIGRFFKRLFR